MVRLADLLEIERAHHLERLHVMPEMGAPTLVAGMSLSKRRVAIVTTAGMHVRSDIPFNTTGSGTDYRVIPGDVAPADLVMSHVSVNFDRSGFQSDANVVFPLERLKELAEQKYIGSVARFHYSFMGAIWPITKYEAKARELAALLKADGVDAVVLSPV
jgi:D-proline reductase (dithiol) PrdB